MANLVLPYPDFQPATKIKSAEVDANFAAITSKINGALNPDNLAYPFLGTGQIGADKSGTATSATQGYNSYDAILRGSGWDGAAAQDIDMILRTIVTNSTTYRFGIVNDAGTELLSLLQNGNVGIGTAAPAVRAHIHEAANYAKLRLSTGATNDYGAAIEFADSEGIEGQVGYSFYSHSMALNTNGLERVRIDSGGNLGVNTTDQFGSGVKVIGIADAGTVPTTNPTGGGVLYAEAGALKWRGSAGSITTLAAA